MNTVIIHTEHIKLSQLLKLSGAIGNGGEARALLAEETVRVNGEPVQQRNKKIYPGDVLDVKGFDTVQIVRE